MSLDCLVAFVQVDRRGGWLFVPADMAFRVFRGLVDARCGWRAINVIPKNQTLCSHSFVAKSNICNGSI
jgi:hypothetical protein